MPTMDALHQADGPATLMAVLGDRSLVEHGTVVSITDRTVIVELPDPTVALGLSVASTVTIVVSFGGGTRELRAVPGRRSSDNPTSRRLELVVTEIIV